MKNWKEINQKYINRGEFYINPRFLETWANEIKVLNKNKIGQPYLYPTSAIEFLAVLHCKGFDYRALQGILTGLAKKIFNFPIICYTQICRRVNKLKLRFHSSKSKLIVAVDGTGEKVTNRGEWMRQKWKIRRGWVKVVIMGAIGGEIIDIRVGNEKLDERKSARGMIRNNHKKIDTIMMDGLHDSKATFNLCEQYNIKTAIKIRKNARTRSKGSPRRRKEVVEYKKLGHKKWVKEKGYGKRWEASEVIFSSNKRIFGENIRATKKRNQYHEAKMKFWAYNKLKQLERKRDNSFIDLHQ